MRRPHTTTVCALVATLCLVGSIRSAAAQGRAAPAGGATGGDTSAGAAAVSPAVATEARAHFERGLALLEAENFDAALAEFERSFALNPRPSVLYNIGVTQQSLRRYPEAARTLDRYLREGGSIAPARRAEVERAVAQLRSLIARVTVVVEPASGTVRLDGRDVGAAPLNEAVEVGPGTHTVEVLRDGQSAGREEFTIASGENRTVRIALRAAQTTSTAGPAAIDTGGAQTTSGGTATTPVASPPTRAVTSDRPGRGVGPVPFFILAGTTVALGGAAIVTGVLTLGARADFERLYADDPPSVTRPVIERGETFRTLTNVFLIGTGVAAVGSVIILTQTRFSAPRATVAFSADPMRASFGATVWGAF